jgi:hypothetical protein
VIFAALLAGAWAYNRYEPSYVQFESEESDDTDDVSILIKIQKSLNEFVIGLYLYIYLLAAAVLYNLG